MMKSSNKEVKSLEQLIKDSKVLKINHKTMLLRHLNNLDEKGRKSVYDALMHEQNRLRDIEQTYACRAKELGAKYYSTVRNFHIKVRKNAEKRSRNEDEDTMEDLLSKFDQE